MPDLNTYTIRVAWRQLLIRLGLRLDYVRAAALLPAEIERLDRAAMLAAAPQPPAAPAQEMRLLPLDTLIEMAVDAKLGRAMKTIELDTGDVFVTHLGYRTSELEEFANAVERASWAANGITAGDTGAAMAERLPADVARCTGYWSDGELRDGCATLKGCAVLAYDAGQGVAIEATEQADGTKKWAVRSRGEVLGRSGEWEWEPMPSSRDAAFLERCRYATPQEALEVLEHARLHA